MAGGFVILVIYCVGCGGVIECLRLEILRLTSFAQDDREWFGAWVCNIGDILLHGNNIGNVKLED